MAVVFGFTAVGGGRQVGKNCVYALCHEKGLALPTEADGGRWNVRHLDSPGWLTWKRQRVNVVMVVYFLAVELGGCRKAPRVCVFTGLYSRRDKDLGTLSKTSIRSFDFALVAIHPGLHSRLK